MMAYSKSLLELIGNTPILQLPKSLTGSEATILCKMESLNPGGSIKDRMAKFIINYEEQRGTIKPGDTICDNTSGNTGVGVAMVAAIKGYKTIFATADRTSKEKIDLIKSFGARVIVTPADVAWDDPRGCYMVGKRLAEENGYYWLNQYHTPLNPLAHYSDTAPELWRQTEGKITHLLAGIGTGGTISGIGRFLKEKNPRIEIVGVEPKGSLFTAIKAGKPLPEAHPHKVEGIGTDMIVEAFQPEYTDRIIQVDDNDAFLETRLLCREIGLSVGGSTGAMFHGVREVAKNLDSKSVVLFFACDSGIRYISKLFSDEWMKQQQFRLESDAPA